MALGGVETRRRGKLLLCPLAREQIGLLAEVEEGIVVPLGIFETVVAWTGLDQRGDRNAHHPRKHVVPESPELAEK